MSLIYETQNFLVEAPELPLVTRTDGGHITISPKVTLNDRSLLSPKLAIELMYLTMLIGEAMQTGMNNRGVDIGGLITRITGTGVSLSPKVRTCIITYTAGQRALKFRSTAKRANFRSVKPGFMVMPSR